MIFKAFLLVVNTLYRYIYLLSISLLVNIILTEAAKKCGGLEDKLHVE